MSSSSLQEDRPTDTGAIISNLESVKLIREVLTELLEITLTMQKTIRTEFLNIVESFAEVFRWYLELYKDGVEVASHAYITAHDLHHQVQAQRFPLQNSRPSKPIQEYNVIEVAIASASRGTATAMRNIRELVRTSRQMTQFYEWTVRSNINFAYSAHLLICSDRGALQCEDS